MYVKKYKNVCPKVQQMQYLTPQQKNQRKKQNKSSKKQTKLQLSTLFYSVRPMALWCQTNRMLGLISFVDELCTNNVACRAVVSRCMSTELDVHHKLKTTVASNGSTPQSVGSKRKAEQMKTL